VLREPDEVGRVDEVSDRRRLAVDRGPAVDDQQRRGELDDQAVEDRPAEPLRPQVAISSHQKP
jgi:hypothetical protein